MLQNAYFVAKIGADTAENEQHFAEILPSDALWRRAVEIVNQPCLEGCVDDEGLGASARRNHAGWLRLRLFFVFSSYFDFIIIIILFFYLLLYLVKTKMLRNYTCEENYMANDFLSLGTETSI